MSKRAVTYARVSYDDRGTDGRNLDSQQDMCRDHCKKHGHTVVAELAEDERGASGADFDLPQLTRVLEMAQAREFDVLVVREVDRLSRDQIKALIVRRDLTRCGVEIEYVLYDFPPGAAGNMARGMMEVIAEYQRQDAIIKTARGRRNSVKSGNINVAGRPPYGYQVLEKDDTSPHRRLAPYEPEARIVRMMFDWYTAGDAGQPLSLGGITRRLAELRIPTPSERNILKGRNKRMGSCEWNRETVMRLLRSETYAGHWYYGKRGGKNSDSRVNPREHWLAIEVPPLVDCETWEAAQKQTTHNRRNGLRQPMGEYLLRHRLTCEKCESGMAAETSSTLRGEGRYQYYKCCARRGKLHYARKCDQVTFRADWVDAVVWKWIKGLLSEPDKLQEAIDALEREGDRLTEPARRQLTTLDELIAEHTADIEQVQEMGRHKVYTLDKAKAEIAKLEEAIAGLKKRQRALAAIIAKQVHSTEQVRAVLAFAKAQGPNVEKATKRFEVRRGLIEDMNVQATLGVDADGVPVVYASCVVGSEVLRDETRTTSGEYHESQAGIVLTATLSLAEYWLAAGRKRMKEVVELDG